MDSPKRWDNFKLWRPETLRGGEPTHMSTRKRAGFGLPPCLFFTLFKFWTKLPTQMEISSILKQKRTWSIMLFYVLAVLIRVVSTRFETIDPSHVKLWDFVGGLSPLIGAIEEKWRHLFLVHRSPRASSHWRCLLVCLALLITRRLDSVCGYCLYICSMPSSKRWAGVDTFIAN